MKRQIEEKQIHTSFYLHNIVIVIIYDTILIVESSRDTFWTTKFKSRIGCLDFQFYTTNVFYGYKVAD